MPSVGIGMWLAGLAAAVLIATWLPATTGDSTADRVLGQAAFKTNPAGAGRNGLSGPSALVIDRSSTPSPLYVADSRNNRVLGYRDAAAFADGAPADLVIGQPDFCSSACNSGGKAGAETLCAPSAVSVDSAGNLYVADTGNNRVLEYDNPFNAADEATAGFAAERVFGQASFVVGECNQGTAAPGADTLCNPLGVAVDPEDHLYVADSGNSRVLRYSSPLSSVSTADLVIGQSDFSSLKCNQGSVPNIPGAASLCFPRGVALDNSGNLYVADQNNNRVMEYDSPSSDGQAAHLVFGQPSFTTSAGGGCAGGRASADGLCFPQGVAVDDNSNLYVADNGNSRVLEYENPLAPGAGTPGTSGSASDTTADLVFGHRGSFSASASNDPAINAESLSFPGGVAVDGAGSLYVADTGNNRVLEYNAASVPLSPARTAGASPAATPSPCPGHSERSARMVAPQAATSTTGKLTVAAKLNFGKVPIFSAGAATVKKKLKLTNKNAQDVTISDSSFDPVSANPGDFAILPAPDSTCSGTVPHKNSCVLAVTFTPGAVGNRTSTLIITDDASNSPQKVGVSGRGFVGALKVNGKPLHFGRVAIGSTSNAKTVSLTNNFDAPITINSVSVGGANGGDFTADATACNPSGPPFQVAKGTPCTLSVTFSPTNPKKRKGTLTIQADDAGTGQHKVAVDGIGTGTPGTPGTATQTPTAIGTPCPGSKTLCSGVCTDTTSDPNNCGTCTNACPAGNACVSSVCQPATSTETPTETPAASGTPGASPSPAPTTTFQVLLVPNVIKFFGVLAGTTATAKDLRGNPTPIILVNDQPNPLNVSGITITSGGSPNPLFAETDNCTGASSPLAAFARCQIIVTFSPTTGGSSVATLTVNTDFAGGLPLVVEVIGFSVAPTATSIATPGPGDLLPPTMAPAILSFTGQPVGTTSGAEPVTLTNNSPTQPLTISGISITRGGVATSIFAETDNCTGASSPISPKKQCTISVTFSPDSVGTEGAILGVQSDFSGITKNPQPVQLVGLGSAGGGSPTPTPGQSPPPPSLTPSSIAFPPEAVGGTSAPMTVKVLNVSGSFSLSISSIAFTGAFSAATGADTCSGATVQPLQRCTVSVVFSPTFPGLQSGSLKFIDNAQSSITNPQTVQLTGIGTP